MASDFSFDVVSDFDQQELVNAVDQTQREMRQRYDLKNTKSTLELEKDGIHIQSESEYVLQSLRDVLESKLVGRRLSIKILDYGAVEPAAGGRFRQLVKLRRGINQDLAKSIVKLIRDHQPKLKAQIQGEAVRVSGKNKDDLQGAIKLLREQDYPVPLQFENYR